MDAIILERIVAGRKAPPFEDLERFYRAHADDVAGVDRPVERAALGGAMADRLGYAFAAGYAAALRSMLPQMRDEPVSLAATEAAGVHPRDIQATLVPDGAGWRLSGHKTWVTAAGRTLLVLARDGFGEDAPLALVRVERDRPGVEVKVLPPLAFVPEVPHAEVFLTDVAVSAADRLPGDGWQHWVKPFRTVEDIHVQAALLGFLTSAGGRYGWPRLLRARLAAQLAGTSALADMNPSAPATHIALAGALDGIAATLETMGLHITAAEPDFRSRWQRDRPLLQVAAKARTLRLDKAWERLGGR